MISITLINLDSYKGIYYSHDNKGRRRFTVNYKNASVGINRKTKSFSLKKYGARKAFSKAFKQRKTWEEQYGDTENIDKKYFRNNYIFIK